MENNGQDDGVERQLHVMEKLHKIAKTLEEDFKSISQDIYSNNPGLSTNKRIPIESIGHSIGVLMAKLSTLRSSVMTKYRDQLEDSNNAKFS